MFFLSRLNTKKTVYFCNDYLLNFVAQDQKYETLDKGQIHF